jgi:hypothetical protein
VSSKCASILERVTITLFNIPFLLESCEKFEKYNGSGSK